MENKKKDTVSEREHFFFTFFFFEAIFDVLWYTHTQECALSLFFQKNVMKLN